MDPILENAVMLDDSAGIDDAVLSDPGAGVDDSAGHDNRTGTNLSAWRDDSGRMNDWRSNAPEKPQLAPEFMTQFVVPDCHRSCID